MHVLYEHSRRSTYLCLYRHELMSTYCPTMRSAVINCLARVAPRVQGGNGLCGLNEKLVHIAAGVALSQLLDVTATVAVEELHDIVTGARKYVHKKLQKATGDQLAEYSKLHMY
ncbi:hypothetical protein HaLaN_14538, partial [Haematococcus lacustris]